MTLDSMTGLRERGHRIETNTAAGSRATGRRSGMFRTVAAGLAAVLLFSSAGLVPARAQDQGQDQDQAPASGDQVALVKVVDGQAFALRDDGRSELGVGAPIFVEDVVETEAGSVGLTFKDGSRISIGPNSRVQFTEFDFAPTEGRLAFVVDFFRGTLLYISGVIAKLSPDAVKVRTPVATVAVRGTRFLAEVEGE